MEKLSKMFSIQLLSQHIHNTPNDTIFSINYLSCITSKKKNSIERKQYSYY